jgi:lysophospholipase L1-like esterase
MLASVATAAPTAAAAASAPPVVPGARYLALGDSVTFGYQEASVVPPPNYRVASSFPGYPNQLGAQLRLNVANAACPGETSASLINPAAPSYGCENIAGRGAGYRTLFPLHVRYRGSQLAYAMSYLRSQRNVRLVSLMVGANDYFLCAATTKDRCSSELPALARGIGRNVRTILSAIRNRAGYHGRLAIVNYYSVSYASAAATAPAALLNRTVDAAARPYTVTIADGFGQFRRAAAHSGADSCRAGLLTQLGTPTQCGVHPSYAGQALLAGALLKAVRLARGTTPAPPQPPPPGRG